MSSIQATSHNPSGQPWAAEESAEARQVLDLWFGELDPRGGAPEDRVARWFKKDPSFDALLRDHFGALHGAIAQGQREHWLDRPWTRLAYVIVLDQFSRNMKRDRPGMFAADARALSAARGAVEQGVDRKLPRAGRTFLYMPLMHSEDLAAQDQCVELFAAMASEYEGEQRQSILSNHKYAVMHRDIVARFGRFPHRNAILGRESSPEELAFLEQPGSSF